jgi:hypothetical protein
VEMHVAHSDMPAVNMAQTGVQGEASSPIHFSYDRMIPSHA